MAQLSDDKKNRRYPVLISDEFLARELEVSVRFKTLSGKVDASGGIVWRYQDEGNYYVARANALEENVVAYKTDTCVYAFSPKTATWGRLQLDGPIKEADKRQQGFYVSTTHVNVPHGNMISIFSTDSGRWATLDLSNGDTSTLPAPPATGANSR